MKRNKTELLGDVLNRYLRSEGLETPLNEHRVINAWGEVMGAEVAARTVSVRIYNRKLYVKLTSSALRSNLFMQRTALVHRLNAYVNADVISDIVFS